jgi:hypothetical protein
MEYVEEEEGEELETVFRVKMQLSRVGDDCWVLYIPPPPLPPKPRSEMFPLKVHPVRVGEEEELYIPAPDGAVFWLNVLLVFVGEVDGEAENAKSYIPPPCEEAEFPVKLQLLTVGPPILLNIPPP